VIKKTKQKIHPYLPFDLHKEFKTYCKAKGLTESSVAESAIREYLDDSKDINLLYRRMDRMNRSLGRVERDLNISSEFLALFVQIWFAYTPQLPDSEKESAQRLSMKRYNNFVQHVVNSIGGGKKFIDDFVSETIGDDEELKAAVEGDPDEQ